MLLSNKLATHKLLFVFKLYQRPFIKLTVVFDYYAKATVRQQTGFGKKACTENKNVCLQVFCCRCGCVDPRQAQKPPDRFC